MGQYIYFECTVLLLYAQGCAVYVIDIVYVYHTFVSVANGQVVVPH